uniref:GYF domain-containing protein n=2 Tax=Caenorhabditis tropicalis TaxID=1561998 RepID=A0A1I7UHM5_9PELO
MMPQDFTSPSHLFKYDYIDLEGNKYGPFEGGKMAEWDNKGLMDDDLIIFRLFASGRVEEFLLKDLRKTSKSPFLELDSSAYKTSYENDKLCSEKQNKISPMEIEKHVVREPLRTHIKEGPVEEVVISDSLSTAKTLCPSTQLCSSSVKSSELEENQREDFSFDLEYYHINENSCSEKCKSLPAVPLKQYHPDVYSSLPFMRLPDPYCLMVKPEDARAKVFTLYQLIITVPEQLRNFPPYTTETVCCQLCKVDLTGPDMFNHLITIQHLGKVSNCIFAESDVDFWISRVKNVINSAPSSALCIPGFEPVVHLNETETVKGFINRTKGFVKKPSIQQIKRQPHVIDAVLNLASATSYASSKVNRSKRKFTGNFLSRVVLYLSKNVNKLAFQKKYGALLDGGKQCTFCDVVFESFYDACCHVGTQNHRSKINNIHYHEGLVATWVRLLAQKNEYRKEGSSYLDNSSTEEMSSIDILRCN